VNHTIAQVLAGEARYHLAHADAFWWLPLLPANSVDALVCDPPSGIAFMGREWDSDRGGRDAWIAWLSVLCDRALRTLKPGAHGLVWSLPRTSHWTAMALENAGFEIRDSIHHVFGSGMPKSYNVDAALRALDAGGTARPEDIRREAMGEEYEPSGRGRVNYDHGGGSAMNGKASQPSSRGTALKPSHEVWWLVRKPLEGTIAENVRKWGTGALNIDACRVASAEPSPAAARRETARRTGNAPMSGATAAQSTSVGKIGRRGDPAVYMAERESEQLGRFPPNLLLSHSDGCEQVGTRAVKANPTWDTPNRKPPTIFGSEVAAVSGTRHGDGETEEVPVFDCVAGCPVRELDGQSGQSESVARVRRNTSRGHLGNDGYRQAGELFSPHSDSGTASRFFPQFQRSELDEITPFLYAAKPSRAERDLGLAHFAKRSTRGEDGEVEKGVRNVHPTGKSVGLMRYLCRLITPPRGVVLDFTAGSGTTGVASLIEGFRFLGCELMDTDDEPFVSIALARLQHALGYEFVPRESLRTASPPTQRSLFGGMGGSR
jgi:hypothetical protein